MDQPVKSFPSQKADTRRWIGRIIIAVILGEAIWGLIVSIMNNVVVPWLGDMMGQSTGLPTSFTQRPYDYPDLLVSVLEFGVAGLVAAVLNYFFQRSPAGRIKAVQHSAPTAPAGPARLFPQPATTAARTQIPSPFNPPAPVAKADPVTPYTPVAVAPAPPVAPAPIIVAHSTPAVADPATPKPLPPAPKAEPAKPKKPKEVFYNIVGEPMPSDDE